MSALPSSLLSFRTYNALSFLQDGNPDILSAACQVLIDWNHQKIPFFSEPSALHSAHVPSMIPGSGGQVARDAETTGHAQIGSLFGEADAEANQDSGLAADNVGHRRRGRCGAGVRGRMIVGDDNNHKRQPTVCAPMPLARCQAVKMMTEHVNDDIDVPADLTLDRVATNLPKRRQTRLPGADPVDP